VGSAVILVDVRGDLGSRLVEGFPFGTPGAALLELAEPGLDERLGLGIAVAAAPVRNATRGHVLAEVLRGELGAVVAAEGELAGTDPARDDRVLDDVNGFVVMAAQLE
jgi:hypothetical protein